jgi:hypothetical protein
MYILKKATSDATSILDKEISDEQYNALSPTMKMAYAKYGFFHRLGDIWNWITGKNKIG